MSDIFFDSIDFIYDIEVVSHLTLSDIMCFRSFPNNANVT